MIGFMATLTLLVVGLGCSPAPEEPQGNVVIGSKNFTEQLILGEMLAQLIEDRTDLQVERRLNLGGTMICHGALTGGEIDLYPEYTGTALTAILNREVISSPTDSYQTVAQAYHEQFDCQWLEPLGFNNTYAITVRQSDAEENGWATIEDLAPVADSLRAGFTAEFAERPDGYPGLKEAYGFSFGSVRDLDPGLMYPAIAQDEVDVICAFATDGRIAAYNLEPLEDNRGFFPPYFAAPVVRQDTLKEYPEIRQAINALAGLLNNEQMQKLNYAVDEEKRATDRVAREYLTDRGLVDSGS